MNWKKLLNSRLHCAAGTRSTCWVPVQQGDCIQRKSASLAQRRQSFLKNNSVALELRFQRNSQGTPGNTKFFNQCFDKNRLKNFVLWFLLQYGEHKTIQLVEQLKNVGFNYASKAGISLGIDDLRVPPKKGELIYEAEKQTYLTLNQYNRGEITGVERFQRLIDTWHRTSETLKQEVINHFEATDILNPVYMMAFSGARGNISQVRQLVGMRGLMADPQGQILDFPIRSNFREGLTLTEYIISSYGARKGIVDTALRTANAGYLTRRLVDVAQHVIISNFDCGTRRGIFLTNMKEGNKTIITLTQRLVGRILARDLTVVSSQKTISNYKRNEEITLDLAFEIGKKFEKVFVRSPLTCETPKLICQLCYGWSLAQGNLVSIGEAVGVVAAQSIGEPGTQLTMRTFHTGGVFSGDVSDQIRAPFNGFIEYVSAIPGTLIRTPEGKIAFLTKAEGSFWVHKKEKLNGSKKYKISPYTLLYKRNAQTIFEKEVIAQISSISQKSNATDDAALTIKSENEGQFYSKSLGFYERLIGPERGGAYGTSNDERVARVGTLALKDPGESDKIYEAWTWGYAWVLSGKIYELKIPSPLFPKLGDYVNTKSIMSETKWKFRAREPFGSTDTVRLKPVHVSSPKATQASLSAGVSSTGYLESCACARDEGACASTSTRDESATLSLAKGAQARFFTHTTSAHNSQTQARLRFAAGANALKGIDHEPVIFTTQKKISFDLAHIVFKKHGYIFQFSELHPFVLGCAPNRVGPVLNIHSRTLKAQTKAKGKDSTQREMLGLLRYPSARDERGAGPRPWGPSANPEAYAGTSGSHETVQANKTLLTGDYVFLDSSYSKRSPSSLFAAGERSYGVEGSLVGAGQSPYYLKNSLIFQWFPTHSKTLTGGYAFIETAPPFLRLKKSLSLNDKQLFNNFSIQERSSPYLDLSPQPLNPRVSSLIHMLAPARTLRVPTHSKGGQGLSPSLAPKAQGPALLSSYIASSENLESSKTYFAFGASKSQAERTLFISKNFKFSPQKMRGAFWSKKMLSHLSVRVPAHAPRDSAQVQAKAAHTMHELLNSRMYLRIFWIPTDFFTVSERNFQALVSSPKAKKVTRAPKVQAEGKGKNLKTATLMYAFSLYRKDWLGKLQKNRQGSYKIISPSLFQYRKGFDPTVISPFEKNNIRDFMYLFFQKNHFIDPSVKGTALLMASLVSPTATQAKQEQAQAPWVPRDAVSSAPHLSSPTATSATSQKQAMSQNSLVMKAREMRALLKNDRKKDFLRYNKIAFLSFSKLVSCAPFTSSHLSSPSATRVPARVSPSVTQAPSLSAQDLNARERGRDAKCTSRKHSNTTHFLKCTSKEQVISNYLIKEYNKFSLIKNKEKFGSLLFCKSFLNSSVFKHLSPPMSLSLRVKDKKNLNIVGTLKKGWILVPCAQVCNKEARDKKAPTTARVLLGHVPAQKTLGTPRKNRGEGNLSLINCNEFTFIYHKKILCPGQMISNSLKFNAPIPLLTECIILKEIFNIQQISIHSILNLKKINKKLFEPSMKEDSFQKNVKENLTPEFNSRNFRNNNILASTQWIRNDKSRFSFETITNSVCTPASAQGPAVDQGYCFDCTNTPSLISLAPSLSSPTAKQAKRNKVLNLALILQPITEHYQENKVFLKKYVSERISTTNSSLLGTSAPKKLSDIFCREMPDELSELKRNQLEDCLGRGRSFQRKQPSLLSSPITQMTAVDLRLLALPAKCKRASHHTYLVNPSYNSFLKWILFKTHQWNKQNKTFFPCVGGVPNPSLVSPKVTRAPKAQLSGTLALGTSAKTAFNPKHDVLIIPNSLFKDLSLSGYPSLICKKSLNFSSFLMILNNKVDKSKTYLTDISGQSRPSLALSAQLLSLAPKAQAQVHMPHTVSLSAYGDAKARDEGVATLTPRNNSEEKQTFSFSYQPFSKFDFLFYPFLFLPYFSSLNINCINTSKAQNHAALTNYLSLNGKELVNSQGTLGERKRSASLPLSLLRFQRTSCTVGAPPKAKRDKVTRAPSLSCTEGAREMQGKNLDTKINSTHFYAKFKHLIPQLFENPCFSWDLISRLDSSFLKQNEGGPASFKTNSKKGNSVILQNAFTLFFQELPSKKSLESISTYSANLGLATRHPHSSLANTKFSSMNLSSRVLCAVNTNHQRPLVSKHSKGESHFLSKPFKGSIFSFNNIGKTTAFYFMSSFAFLPQAQGTGTEFKTSFELAKTTHYSPFNGEIVYVKLKASPYLVGVEGLGTQPSYSLSRAPRDSAQAHLSSPSATQATSCMVLTKLDLISYYFPSFKLCTPLASLASATRMQVHLSVEGLGTQLSYSSDSRLSATTQAKEQSQGCSLVSPTATHVPAPLAQALLDEPKPPIGLHASKDLSRDKKYLIKDIFIKFGRMSQKTLRHASPKAKREREEACLHREIRCNESVGSMQGLRSTQDGAREGVERDIREQIKISKLVAGFPEHNSSRRVLPLATVTQQLVSMQGFSHAVKRARDAQIPSTHSAALSLHHRYKQSESLNTNISNKACSLLGDFLVYGDDINQKNINENLSKGVQEPLKLFTFRNERSQAVQTSGQIIHYNNEKITLRRSQPIFISPKAILHKFDGDFVNPKAPVITLSYKQLKTGDIIQGIPKVEQFFEARTTKRGHLFRDSLPSLLKGLFKRFLVFLPLDLAVRQSIYKIQQIIVDGVLRVYKSQGVTIADKHLEVIVKQMTGKVRILEGAQTGFFPGEVLDLCFVEKINRFLIKKVTYEPLVLGITKASLEVESFLSAASFQQTTRVLSQAALYRKKDFLKGLKENVILGNLIPAGTGYLVFLDDVTASVVSP